MLVGLIALPLGGATIALVMGPIQKTNHLRWFVYGIASAITFLFAWVLRPAHIETVFGDWSPISFTGTPLILTTNPEGITLLIAFAGLMTLNAFTRNTNHNHLNASVFATDVIAGLVFSALAITALANNFVTLVIGIGLVDMLSGLYGILDRRPSDRVLSDAILNGLSLAFIVAAIALYGVTSNSLYLPLARTPERLAPFLSIALALRFSLLPFRAASDLGRDNCWTHGASVAAGLLLLARLPQTEAPEIRAWFYGLAVLTAIITLALGALSNDNSTLRAAITAGALGLTITTAVTWHSGAIIVATIAWLLGIMLINQDDALFPAWAGRIVQSARLVGVACLIGLPLTPGFVGRAGVIATWAARGPGGAALIVGLTIAHILLTICVLRLAFRPEAPGQSTAQRWLAYADIAILVILCVCVILFGLAPDLAGAKSLGAHLGSNGFLGWLLWLLATALGAAAWWFEAYWLRWFNPRRDWLMRVLSLRWMQDILAGALNRIARSFRGVTVFLESDGALLWALIIVLIVVLVSRPGGP